MPIKVNEMIPDVTLPQIVGGETSEISTATLFADKKAILFAVPGAFTPTCSDHHLPGFVINEQALKDKGVDLIACLSVNDAYVMKAWYEAHQVPMNIVFLADGSGILTKKMDMEFDITAHHLGVRSMRYAMVIDNGKISQLFVDGPGEFDQSSAENVLAHL